VVHNGNRRRPWCFITTSFYLLLNHSVTGLIKSIACQELQLESHNYVETNQENEVITHRVLVQ